MSRIDGNDVVAAIGLALLGVGLYLAWPPLALIIVGAVLLIAGVLGAQRAVSKREDKSE